MHTAAAVAVGAGLAVVLAAPLGAPTGATSTTAASATAATTEHLAPRIVPNPAGPRDEPEIYRNGCHAGRVVTTARFCVYGDRGSARTMVVFGDSHVAQWFSALTGAAEAEHVKLYWLTKSACPAIDVSVRVWRGYARYTQCDTWRPRAMRKIAELAPDLVVTSSYSFHQVLDGRTGAKLRGAARKAEWRRGATRTLEALSAAAGSVVQLRDTARQQVDVPVCLVRHHLRSTPCRTKTSWALPGALWRVERKVGAALPDVQSLDLSTPMCGPHWCAPLDGKYLRWRDDSHLTDTYSHHLAPLLRPYLRAGLRGGRASVDREARVRGSWRTSR